MSSPYPFVNDIVTRVNNINNTPQIIGGSDYPCVINSIFLTNTSAKTTNQQPVLVNFYILTEISEDVTQNTPILGQVAIPPNSSLEVIPESNITLAAGEILYAYSDYSSNFFSSNVSCRTYTPPS